jgi:Fe-S-cluster containining protein
MRGEGMSCWDLFECQRCGRCCIEIGLPYDPESIFKIARFLELTVDQVIDKYYGRVSEDENGKYWESEDHKRTPCPFLGPESDNKKTCIIYEMRPEGCRLYPFETDGGRQGVDCPGARIYFESLGLKDI